MSIGDDSSSIHSQSVSLYSKRGRENEPLTRQSPIRSAFRGRPDARRCGSALRTSQTRSTGVRLSTIEKTPSKQVSSACRRGSHCILVARTGFEPVISALRGRCPSPLDERAMLAGVLGLEPRLSGTRIRRVASYTIPLYLACAARGARRYPTDASRGCQPEQLAIQAGLEPRRSGPRPLLAEQLEGLEQG